MFIGLGTSTLGNLHFWNARSLGFYSKFISDLRYLVSMGQSVENEKWQEFTHKYNQIYFPNYFPDGSGKWCLQVRWQAAHRTLWQRAAE